MAKGKKSSKSTSRFQAREAEPLKPFNPKSSRVNKINTVEEAFGGDEDEFHKNRDEVLFELDGQQTKGGMDELSEDDEIYDLNLPSSSDEDEDEVEADQENIQEDDDDEMIEYEEEEERIEEPRGRFAKSANPSQDLLSDDDNNDKDEDDEASNSDDDEETWAANSYHASRRAPGEADSEDDEALEMEADEARRLQKRQRGVMAGDDFGLGGGAEEDEEELERMREASRKAGKLEEDLVVKVKKGDLSNGEGETKFGTEEEAIAYLLRKQPETLALLDDFTETAERMTNVEKALEIVRLGEDGKEHPALAIMEMEHQALSTYLPTLAFYFSLLLAPTTSSELLTRVLARLTSLRSALATMEELDLTAGSLDGSDDDDSDEEEDDEDEDEEGSLEDDESALLASDVWDLGQDEDADDEMLLRSMMQENGEDYDSGDEEITDSMIGGLDDDELEELMADMAGEEDGDELIERVKAIQRAKHGLPPLATSATISNSASTSTSTGNRNGIAEVKQKKKRGRSKAQRKREAATSSLLNLTSPSSLPPSSLALSAPNLSSANDDYLDPTFLSMADLSDKAARKHTLRFHVSQVHQKTVKRESGGANRIGGDDDLPRRSKERSRREVLKRQEHGGGKGEELDGEDWNESDKKRARGGETGGEGEVEEDYYDLVKRETREGKVAKKVKYDDQVGAAKAELDELTDASAAGPRGANRKIMANKGLQPKRAKVNRNPRVKKRLRYDKAVKKVASMKSVYKGGLATLGHKEYSGEKSGITNNSKSVRLGGK